MSAANRDHSGQAERWSVGRRLTGRAPELAPRVGLTIGVLVVLLAVGVGVARVGPGLLGLAPGMMFSSSLPGRIASSGWAVLAQDDELWLSDADGQLHLLASAPAGGHFENPAWRPDGQEIAYTLVVPRPPSSADQSSPGFMVSSAIWRVDRTGAARALVQPDSPDVWLSEPAWSPDGSSIFYVRSAFVLQGAIESQERWIERRVLATGDRRIVVADGLWPAIGPDGDALAWVQFGANERADLWVRSFPAGTPRRLTDGRFATIDSPRFSPGGRTIAFSGAPFRPKYQVRKRRASPMFNRVLGWLAEPAGAHSLPSGLWMVDVDGSHLRPVGTFALDAPDVRWTDDPNELLLHDEQGLYAVDVRQGQLQDILEPGSFRGFDWLPKPRGAYSLVP